MLLLEIRPCAYAVSPQQDHRLHEHDALQLHETIHQAWLQCMLPTFSWHQFRSVACRQAVDAVPDHASSGIQLVQDLKEHNIYSVKPIKPQGDKQTRLFAQSGLFESGVVRVPQEARWMTDFVHEITSFPVHKFDDQVDAISQGLAYLRERLDEPGFIAYMRQEYEAKHGHTYKAL
jgi:predicted phage terminase large subunit-like protein